MFGAENGFDLKLKDFRHNICFSLDFFLFLLIKLEKRNIACVPKLIIKLVRGSFDGLF